MNSPTDHCPSRGTRYARMALVLLALAAPLVMYGARKALRSTSNDPRQWLPRTFAETDTYDWFQAQFGSDEIAVVSWPGCTLEDPRVQQVAAALQKSQYFDSAISGQSVLSELMASPLSLTRGAALRRLRGTLVGPEGEITCLVLATSAAGRADRSEAVAEIQRTAESVAGLAASELKLAGPTVDAALIDAESRHLLFQLAGLSALISFFIATMRLKSIALAIMILVVAMYSTGLSLAILYFSGGEMNLLMTMLPPLVYVLSISSAVHLANYYRDAHNESSSGALAIAVKHGWLPCVLAATTTGIGLVSLVMSKIDPIRMFGIYSAIGVVVSVGVLFVMLPAALHLFPPKSRSTGDTPSPTPSRLSRGIIAAITRHHVLVMLSCLTLMAFCGWGLPYIKSTVKLQDRFLPSSDAISDYRWLEQHVGPMVPLEVVVHFSADDPRDLLEQLQIVAEVQGTIQSVEEPVATLSAVNLSPRIPTGSTIREVIARKLISRPQTQERLSATAFLANSDGQRLWRITVRANAIGDLDYGLFAERLRAKVDPLLEQHGVTGTYTGVIPLIYKAQRQLLQDLFRSFLAAFAVIAVVLVFVLRSISAALLAMIPNLFPAVVVFGSLEWIDVPIQIGSVMTASAALGIAVDDTVHFLTWFRRGINEGMRRHDALRDAFQRCSGAMVHTTLICSSGLLVFAASTFVPILHFAWLMVFLLLSALVGDLLLLPALLAGPLGRCFESSKNSAAESLVESIDVAGEVQ